ncbi:MAG: hypothetical protein AMXMBFR84_33950 [Candidatus Hydrogenedentota bacterium]
MASHPIRTVAVIGAGDMGHGIAEVALIAGFRVHVQDMNQDAVDRGKSRIDQSLLKLREKGKVTPELFERIQRELIHTTTELKTAVADADLVIEAIPEVMSLKRQCFEQIDQYTPSHALLASNTSTMRITEIASATRRPEQVLGLHFFNPAVLMRLVEVIRGDSTGPEAIDSAYAFCQACGKIPVVVRKDVPGFIVNRVQAPSGVLLSCLADEGRIEPEGIDSVMRNLGMPMGPFELFDYTGLDINVNAMKYFAEAVHPDFSPGTVLSRMVDEGHLGKKTGRGFFDWTQGRPAIDLGKSAAGFDPLDLLAVNANEAAKLIEMDVCSAEDVDLAIVNGSGNTVGPMTLIRSIEPEELCNRLNGLSDRYGKEIFRPARLIREGGYR